jgi:two-component system chemotaxis response regulator CheY
MKKILVVDDSPFVRNFHANIIEANGEYKTEQAENGADALTKILSNPFDLIVCDINMTIMDGLTFVEKLRGQEIEIPVIIISTYDDETIQTKVFEAGANIFMPKPVTNENLIGNINLLLA